ncbi:MAG: FAD-dependent oxidoreductase, partial [Candidatus Methanofastidiosa archaeon]|nr:FAD-dependent oxidoreductase [Candidatus Methanofastidiosa archaeon]
MNEEKIVFIGGGAAGATAALETRKRLRDAEITILESGAYPQYSCCALPFVLGGEIDDYRDIILFDEGFYKEFGKMDLLLNTKALAIDRDSKKVICEGREFEYDKLVITTGSYAFVPPISGLDKISFGKRTFLYKFMPEAKALHDAAAGARRALVIGAGLVGMEVADALNRRGVEVTMIELLPTIMHVMVDDDMARMVTGHFEENGIKMFLGTKVTGISESQDLVSVATDEGEHAADLCILASGVRAETGIARDAGLEVGRG